MTRWLAPLLAAVLLSGCSVALEFTDGCETHADCADKGAGVSCIDGLCVLATEGGLTADALLAQPCGRLYGATVEEVLAPDSRVLLLGTLLPASGALGAYGPPIDKAVELAVTEINQVGGLFGTKLAVISCDTGTDVAQAEKAARHLADVANVPAVIGAAASSITIEVFNTVAKEAGMLMISPASTSPALSDLPDDGLLWRTAPSDAGQGAAIARHLLAQKYKKVAVINRDDAYGQGLRAAIQAVLCGDSFDCNENLYTRSYGDTTETDDQSKAIVELKGDPPDVIVLIAFLEDGKAFMKAAHSAGLTDFILTDGTKSDELIDEVPDEVLCKAFGTNPASPSGAPYQAFAIRYEGKWGEPPGAFNANSYDALYLLGYALATITKPYSEVVGADIAAGLKRLSEGSLVGVGTGEWNSAIQTLRDPEAGIDFEGASGALNFDNDKGEAASEIEGFYFDLDKKEVKTLGVIYTEDGTYTAPQLPSCDTLPDEGG